VDRGGAWTYRRGAGAAAHLGTPGRHVPAVRDDGVVRVDDQLYVRSAYGPDNPWFRRAKASGVGRIGAGGLERDVTFAEAARACATSAGDSSIAEPIAEADASGCPAFVRGVCSWAQPTSTMSIAEMVSIRPMLQLHPSPRTGSSESLESSAVA
jgi:Uncharacterized protein conserved in bacteria (DUF2255)